MTASEAPGGREDIGGKRAPVWENYKRASRRACKWSTRHGRRSDAGLECVGRGRDNKADKGAMG